MAERLSILIPAYNEAATIAEVVRQVRSIDLGPLDREIIVVDDGSRDATADEVSRGAADDPRVLLLRHSRNRGKGAAIRTALACATGDLCLVQDADLEYSVADYRALLLPLLAGASVVFGSRFAERRWPVGMRLPNWLANLIFGLRLTDEATCFKVFRIAVLRQLDLECTGFEFCPEVTAKLGLMRVPIVEVPVRYRGRTGEQGKKIRARDGLIAIATLLRHWWRGNGPRRRFSSKEAVYAKDSMVGMEHRRIGVDGGM